MKQAKRMYAIGAMRWDQLVRRNRAFMKFATGPIPRPVYSVTREESVGGFKRYTGVDVYGYWIDEPAPILVDKDIRKWWKGEAERIKGVIHWGQEYTGWEFKGPE